jgi:hypothetical protein
MSRLSLTVLKHLPIGFWLIVAWCALQGVPLFVVSTRLEGDAAGAAILASAVQLGMAAGMLLRLRWVRLLLIAYVAGSLFIGTVAVAILALLYTYVGLAQVETLIAGMALVYYAFMIWAFFYLFHPNLTDVFEWHWAQNHIDRHPGTAVLPQAA